MVNVELKETEAELIKMIREIDDPAVNILAGYCFYQEHSLKVMEGLHEPTSLPLKWQRERVEQVNEMIRKLSEIKNIYT